jgi:hypothetical protein
MVAPGLNAQSYAVQRGVFVATEHMTVAAGGGMFGLGANIS